MLTTTSATGTGRVVVVLEYEYHDEHTPIPVPVGRSRTRQNWSRRFGISEKTQKPVKQTSSTTSGYEDDPAT
eukprot:2739072-Rhodomonas_salina.1